MITAQLEASSWLACDKNRKPAKEQVLNMTQGIIYLFLGFGRFSTLRR